MELNKVKEIVEKYTIPIFPSNIQIGEWVEAISIVLGLIDKEQENYCVDKKNPCEHAGVDYWYYPLTKEFYIALDEKSVHFVRVSCKIFLTTQSLFVAAT